MARIQFAAATSTTLTPYIRLLKFSDGAASIFPVAFGTPVPLNLAAFSPDAAYLIASTPSASTSPLRLWKQGTDSFSEITLPAQASAKTINGLAWMTNTHIVFSCSVTGLWFGVLNRTTDEITLTLVNATVNMNLSVHPNTTDLMVLRTNSVAFFTRSGDTMATASGSMTPANYAWTQGDFAQDGNAWTGAIASPVSNDMHLRRVSAARTLVVTNMTYAAVDLAMGGKFYKWSRKNQHVYIISAFVPYLRIGELVNNVPGTSLRFLGATESDSYPTFSAAPNALCEIDMGEDAQPLVLVACASNTITTGRLRAFRFNQNRFIFREDTSVGAMFDDWATAIAFVVSSRVQEIVEHNAQIYDTGPSVFVGVSLGELELKLALLSAATFNAGDTSASAIIGANEVHGSSWPEGGIAGFGSAVAIAGGITQLKLDIPATALVAPGAFDFRYGLIYSYSDDKPVALIDFGTTQSVAQGDSLAFSGPSGNFALFSVDR